MRDGPQDRCQSDSGSLLGDSIHEDDRGKMSTILTPCPPLHSVGSSVTIVRHLGPKLVLGRLGGGTFETDERTKPFLSTPPPSVEISQRSRPTVETSITVDYPRLYVNHGCRFVGYRSIESFLRTFY